MDARTDELSAAELNGLVLRLMHSVNDRAFKVFGNKVVSGPFGGMEIPCRAPWDDGNSGVKLLGVYEHELHETIENIIWRQPKAIINIGCAEGYYAIGFAQRLSIPIYAYDIEPLSLECAAEYAARNKVKINLIKGVTKPEDLRPESSAFYLFDCEGDELKFVDLGACPELVNSDILVECHDFLDPTISRQIADRLEATHRIDIIRPKLPDFGQFNFLRHYPNIMSVLLVTEKRPMPCCWLMCWANSRS